ncbi:MAG TPA: sulfatase-like hydrolase/transferase, partial [Opitutaceae bacterium]|nr:sulfatase-like hydrolase/transferase [Opitutaceae bacterium]
MIINGISRIGSMTGGKAARWSDEDIADLLTKKADDFIADHKRGPFFLLLGTHDPHVPRLPHPRFRGKSQAGLRGDAVVQLDWLVGEVMQSLAKHGVAEKTLVIFTSDNGAVQYDGYFDGSEKPDAMHAPSGGLRGWKYLRYEGGTRVPLLVRWPGHAPAGTTSPELFSLHDVFASTVGLLGRELPAGAGRDGMDLSALWRGQRPEHSRKFLVQQGIGNVLALRWGDWKFLPANARVDTAIRQERDPRDQRFVQAEVKQDELYQLDKDPAETKNIAPAYPNVVTALRRLLEELRTSPEDVV